METQEGISRRDAPFGEFAFEIVKTYLIFLGILTILSILTGVIFLEARVVSVLFGGTIYYLITALSKGKLGYGFRGWSNIRVDTQPKIVTAILCWPIFLIWIVSWPMRKIYQIISRKYSDTPDQQ